jgi:pimeloyl-ACP methyl ester carboxylesterase
LRAALISLVVIAAAGCPGFHSGVPAGAPPDATFVEIDGVPMRYTDVGEGPAVVLIHGYSSSLDIWKRVTPQLAERHRVIAVDLKGFGWSGRPAGDYSPAAHARMVWSLLDERGVRDAAVVGHSWGSSVALAMALEAPERVRRVALYSAYVYEDQVPSFLLWARKSGIGEMLFSLYYRERLEDRVPLAYHDQSWVTQERVDHVEREFNRTGAVAAALASARGQRYTEMEKRYAGIDKPVLLLWGRQDQITPIGYGERLALDLPNATLEVVDQCGHIPMVEAEKRTTRVLAEFLAKDAQ